MSSKRVYWIEGDGIGPEIWRAARPVIDAALAKESDMRIEWVELLAGEKATAETGSPLPEETMNALRTADFAMKGPLGTPVGTGIRSLNVALRQTLDLYACIRPVRHFEGLETPVKHPERVNMVIFRENTEDVYAGIEYAAQTPEAKKLIAFLREEFGVTKIREEAAVGIKPMSEFGSKRLVRRALRFALDTGSKSLTLVHKGNIMKFTEGGFRQWGYDVAAQEFGDLTCTEKEPVEGRLVVKDRIADAMFQEALLRPEQYQILATPNLNGDYISDALAAQVGGLGLAPGVNMSDSLAFYEATPGTAPTIAGQDKANPGSVILCGALMLEQMGVPAAAERIRNAMSKAIAGRAVTVDLAAQVEGARVVGIRRDHRRLPVGSRVIALSSYIREEGRIPAGMALPPFVSRPVIAGDLQERRMVSLEKLLLYIPLAALLVMLPGPDFALIVRTSLTEGRSSGQAAACGVALGIMVHTSAAMLGISAVIAQSVTLFTLLRYAGAAYLFWMGIHALRAGREVTAAVVRHGGQKEEVQPVRGLRRRAFRQGFLTNALNPKAVVFFLTMLPQFLDPHAALWPQFLELGGIMAFFCLGWFVLLASLLHRIRRLFARPSFQAWLHRLTGLIFICFAFRLALEKI